MPSASPAAHALYGASSAKGWTSCAGRIGLSKHAPPSFDNEWSIDGKIAHALLAKMFEAREEDAKRYVGQFVEYDGEGDEIVMGAVKPETARAVQVCLDYVYGLIEGHDDAIVWIEKRVEIPSQVVPGQMWGTGDVFIYLPLLETLYAIDYKHGVGIYVDETDNMQIKFYALGAMIELNRPISRVIGAIVQPRSFQLGGAVRDDEISIVDLLTFHDFLEERADASLDENAAFTPSADYCRWCPAATICRAYEEFSLSPTGAASLAELQVALLPTPSNLPVDRVAMALQSRPFVTGWYKTMYELGMGAARKGYDVPGFKLVAGQATRAWHGEEVEIAASLAMVTGLPEDRFYPRQMITLTEAEQIVVTAFREGVIREPKETKKAHKTRANKAAEMAHEFMANLTLKEPRGSTSLVPITDPRPRLDPAASNFEGVLIPQET